jgi:hypothetical protein
VLASNAGQIHQILLDDAADRHVGHVGHVLLQTPQATRVEDRGPSIASR